MTDPLMTRLEAFDIDGDDPEFTFTARLARENGWTESFSARAVREYKRFVYLGLTAGHPVTPSEHVDQVWHLHLTYTKSYWERMCGEVLGRAFHHNPTRGGDHEADKFDDWYARTKESYERVFGEAAPEDLWPPSERRFGTDLRWKRVNLAESWVVSRRVVRRAVLTLVALVTLAAVLPATGCTGPQTNNTNNMDTTTALVVIGMVWSVIGMSSGVCGWRYGSRESARKGVKLAFVWTLCFASVPVLVLLLLDRYQLVKLWVGQDANNIASVFMVGVLFLGAALGSTGPGGSRGGGGCGWFGCGGGGCGGGGCGGCGGCGG